MNRNDLQALTRQRLREARILRDNQQWSGAYYLTGLAVECALKACIARGTARYDFPEKKRVQESDSTADRDSPMASAALVEDDIKRGREVLRALSTSGVRPQAAFWYSSADSPDWKFVIAMPAVSHHGPRKVYERVQRILRQKHVDLPVWRITLTSTDDPLARWAHHRVAGAKGDVRSGGNTVNSTTITDAYIYRRPSASSA